MAVPPLGQFVPAYCKFVFFWNNSATWWNMEFVRLNTGQDRKLSGTSPGLQADKNVRRTVDRIGKCPCHAQQNWKFAKN